MDTLEHSQCCTDVECASGLRNNYFRGKHLTPNSYAVEQRYHVERRKLLNRALHGHGIAYGYGVMRVDEKQLCVKDGLALDECGRELLQIGTLSLAIDDAIVLDRDGKYVPQGKRGDDQERARAWTGEKCWRLSVHYAERQVGPLDLQDPCSCARKEWDQVCETVRYSLMPVDCNGCCVPYKCGLDCACGNGPCCTQHAPATAGAVLAGQQLAVGLLPVNPQVVRADPNVIVGTGAIRQNPNAGALSDRTVVPRGGCRCLCEYVTVLDPNVECEPFCEIEEACARVRVDLGHGVPLACVTLQQRDCNWDLVSIYDDCGPRRIIKGNDLLFELIQGCDLTYVEHVGWEPWHRGTMPFDRFAASFDGGRKLAWETWGQKFMTQADFEAAFKVSGRVSDIYWMIFSKPVRIDTLRPDSFAMTVVLSAQQAAWGKPRRVPIVDVIALPDATCPPHHARMALLVFDDGWVSQHFGAQPTFTHCSEIFVEIQVRATYIVDCNGQRPDLRAWGHRVAPTGRGESGADLISTFHVHGSNVDERRLQPRMLS